MENKILKIKIFATLFIQWFVFIAAGILIICAFSFSFSSDGGDIPRSTPMRIVISALLTAVVTTIFSMFEPAKKSSVLIIMVLHFCCLTGIMIACGIYFKWIDFKVFGVMDMVVSVAAVYVFVIAVYFILDKHRAEQINRRLRQKYKDDEE